MVFFFFLVFFFEEFFFFLFWGGGGSERAAFLRKVYGILFLGILGFAATLWASANVPVVHDWSMSIGRAIYGSRFGWLLYMAIFIGGSMAVHSVAERKVLGWVAFGVWAFVLALLVSPIVLMVNGMADGATIISQASGLTALVFGGLTAYVLYTGSDFSWLRGALTVLFFALMGVALLGWLMGFTLGLWYSLAVVMMFAGYILYDTSQILHRLPTTMAMSGAILLFTDVVLLFKHLLILLASSRD